MIVIDCSDLDNDDMFEDPQSLMDAGGMLHATAEDTDKDENCPTAIRPTKSKGTHAGAALYISVNTMQSRKESSLSLLQCQVIHTGKPSITFSINKS